MNYEVRHTQLLEFSTGRSLAAEFWIWEEDPDNEDLARIELRYDSEVVRASAEDFFTALVIIRGQVEPRGLLIECYGASKNVYPSPMIRAMGSGERAYKLTLGKQALKQDLVQIFERGADVIAVTVSEQEKFYQEWLQSLGKTS